MTIYFQSLQTLIFLDKTHSVCPLMTSFSFSLILPTSLTYYNLDLIYFSNLKTNNIEIMCHILGNITLKAN